MAQSVGNRTTFRTVARRSDILIILNVHFLNLIIKKNSESDELRNRSCSDFFG